MTYHFGHLKLAGWDYDKKYDTVWDLLGDFDADFYECDVIQAEFNKWIKDGMKNGF